MKRSTVALLAAAVLPAFTASADTLVAAADKKKPATPAAPVAERKGPAKIKAPTTSDEDFERSIEADKKRDEEIDHLKRIIPKINDPGQKGELVFRLAELYWEKSRFINMGEAREYDKVYGAWGDCVSKSGQEKCGKEPTIDTKKSDVHKKEALGLYSRILKDYPKYPRKDEVLFVLAYNTYDLGDKKAAVQQYNALIKQYPKSKFVPDAYVAMGEYFFNATDIPKADALKKARAAYEKALEFKSPKIFSFALYKLAWCDFNQGDYDGAIDKFKQVIAYSDKQAKADPGQKDKIQLKNEAMNDIVLSFVQVDAVDSAVEFFKTTAGEARAKELIEKLANKFFESGKYDPAIKVFRGMITDDPANQNDPHYEQQIVFAYDKLNKRDKVKSEMQVLVENYSPKSAWAKQNAGNKAALESATDATESAMRTLVQDYHQEAIKTKSVATYELAEGIYKQYLDYFPDAESAYNLRFYYAEILFALQKYELAAEQYDKVREMDPKGVYAAKSSYDAVLSNEKLVKIDKGELKLAALSSNTKIDEKANKGTTAARKQLVAAASKADVATELTAHEKSLVAACDRYVKAVPNAKDEITVKYEAAFVFYDHKDYKEAAQRFGEIILRWPGDQWSGKAANLILASLETKEEWAELNDLARKFHENKKLSPAGSATEKDFAKIVENSQFKLDMVQYADATAKKDQPGLAAAATRFREFVKEFPKSALSPKALYNATVVYDNADELDNATVVAEQLVTQFPETDKGKDPASKDDPPIIPEMILRLASLAERTARFDKAANYYEQYVSRFTKEKDAKLAAALYPRAADALYNAAIYHEGLGDDATAITEYGNYIKTFKTDAHNADLAFKVGLIYEREKKWRDMYDAFGEYQKTYGKSVTAAKRVIARYKTAIALSHTGVSKDQQTAEEIQDQIVRDYETLEGDDKKNTAVIEAAAQSRFRQLGSKFDKFIGIKFTSSKPQVLAGELKEKAKEMGDVEASYTTVLKYGAGTWGVAALCKIGEAYKNFSKSLLEAPMPKGLDADQQEMYRAALEEKALPLEEKSVEAYEKALQTAFKLGIYNEWALKAEDAIKEFKPDEFGDIHQMPFAGSEYFITAAPESATKSAAATSGAGSN